MKKLVTGIALLIIILLGTPIVNGILMEKVVHKAIKDMNTIYADTGTDYSIELVSYNRGLFSSDIDWKINFGELKAVYGIKEVLLSDHARHGYTGVTSISSLDNNKWFSTFIDEKLQGQNPFKISTRYSLLGNIKNTCTIDEFSLTVDEQNIRMLPGRFDISTDSSLRQFTSSLNWQGINLADKIIVEGMAATSDLEMLSTFLWDGDALFTLQNLTIKEGQAPFELSGFSAKYALNVDQPNTNFSTTSDVSIKTVVAGGNKIDNMAAQLAVKNVDTNGYEMFMKTYLQLMSEVLGIIAEAENNPEQATEILEQQLAAGGFQLIGAFEKLLTKDFEIEISDAHMTLNSEDLNADITVRLLKDMTLMEFAPVVGQPDLVFDILYFKSAATIPAGLVGDNPILLEPAYPGMQTGLFEKDGNTLNHSAETRQGKLYINNKEVILQ